MRCTLKRSSDVICTSSMAFHSRKHLVVGRRQRDLSVLHDVDHHAPRRLVGRRRNQHRTAGFEKRDALHALCIGVLVR